MSPKFNLVHGFTLFDGPDGVTFVAQKNSQQADCAVPTFLMPWSTVFDIYSRLGGFIQFQEYMLQVGADPEDASDRRACLLEWISTMRD